MNEHEFIARTVNEHPEKNLPVVLISLLDLKGSTPRHEGSKMAVGDGGKAFGTIGGSLLEAEAVNKARKVLKNGCSEIFTFDLTGVNVENPDMICGGNAEILLEYMAPTEENRLFVKQWYENISNGQNCYLCTCLQRGDTVSITGRALISGNDVTGTLPEGIQPGNLKEEFRTIREAAVRSIKNMEVLIEPVKRVKTLYCFGAGHVGVPTAHIAALAGFHVVVVDDRSDFANTERFPEAREVIVTDDFSHAVEKLPIDEDSFIVIITRGHQYDRVVLEQALKTNAQYIGMISSRKKRDTIYAALKETGVPQEALDKVHSPIGIAIGGESPGEIAVSIVAELISVRSGSQP